MQVNLTKLITGITDNIIIDDIINIDKNMLKNTDIKDISDINVNGVISLNGDDLQIDINIKCTLTLICSISLKEVKYDINTNINEIINYCNESKNEENVKIINNTIDLIPIIWQNIILEVPLKVVSPDIEVKNMHGDGWKFITDEEVESKDIDPRLKGLEKFLDE